MRSSRQRGFTLIELMVALLVSSLLVGMILAIFSRMSMAYRGQQQIAGVQQVLAAARATIELDAKQAGLGVAPSFRAAPIPGADLSPVWIVNNSAGPDMIAFVYADTSTQALLNVIAAGPPAVLTVDTVEGFKPGDLIVVTGATTTAAPAAVPGADLTTYGACVLQIDAVDGSVAAGPPATLTITTAAPWAGPGGGVGHCTGPTALAVGKMVYKLVAHAYKIDAARGVLQQSLTGGLLAGGDEWNDLAYGFSDIQVALRVYHDPVALPDPDGDGDPARDWYSDGVQDLLTTNPIAAPAPPNPVLLQMSISLVAHTDRDVEGISTSTLPAFSTGNVSNNSIGDRPAVPLPTPPLYPGLRIYRYTTFQVDFRNLGVGR